MNNDIGVDGYNRVVDFWKKNENIKIIDNAGCKNGRCIIYASSNGIWNPNTLDVFCKRIIENDYYEWKSWGGGEGFQRIIYVRDILKEWYVRGCSEKLPTIDALIEYLKPVTKEFRLVTVGNSAGGYLAVILGIKLAADHVISISGQNNIEQYVPLKNEYPELYQADKNPVQKKYFNLVPLLEDSKIPVFYFFAADCIQDMEQYELIKGFKYINVFKFQTKEHGQTMYVFNYPKIIRLSTNDLIRLSKNYKGKKISARKFAKDTLDKKFFWRQYPAFMLRHWIRKIKNKIKNCYKKRSK